MYPMETGNKQKIGLMKSISFFGEQQWFRYVKRMGIDSKMIQQTKTKTRTCNKRIIMNEVGGPINWIYAVAIKEIHWHRNLPGKMRMKSN